MIGDTVSVSDVQSPATQLFLLKRCHDEIGPSGCPIFSMSSSKHGIPRTARIRLHLSCESDSLYSSDSHCDESTEINRHQTIREKLPIVCVHRVRKEKPKLGAFEIVAFALTIAVRYFGSSTF
jgi:hypothetical protein